MVLRGHRPVARATGGKGPLKESRAAVHLAHGGCAGECARRGRGHRFDPPKGAYSLCGMWESGQRGALASPLAAQSAARPPARGIAGVGAGFQQTFPRSARPPPGVRARRGRGRTGSGIPVGMLSRPIDFLESRGSGPDRRVRCPRWNDVMTGTGLLESRGFGRY